MNIFALYPSPQESARAHCDQHLHKMILESAQLVSSALQLRGFNLPGLYKLAYPKHPCTIWAARSNHNVRWICSLAFELDTMRQELSNCGNHSSAHILKLAEDFLEDQFPYTSPNLADVRTFAGPAHIKMQAVDTEEKYRRYYRQKHLGWLRDKGTGMTWKGRQIPDFMTDLIT